MCLFCLPNVSETELITKPSYDWMLNDHHLYVELF